MMPTDSVTLPNAALIGHATYLRIRTRKSVIQQNIRFRFNVSLFGACDEEHTQIVYDRTRVNDFARQAGETPLLTGILDGLEELINHSWDAGSVKFVKATALSIDIELKDSTNIVSISGDIDKMVAEKIICVGEGN